MAIFTKSKNKNRHSADQKRIKRQKMDKIPVSLLCGKLEAITMHGKHAKIRPFPVRLPVLSHATNIYNIPAETAKICSRIPRKNSRLSGDRDCA